MTAVLTLQYDWIASCQSNEIVWYQAGNVHGPVTTAHWNSLYIAK